MTKPFCMSLLMLILLFNNARAAERPNIVLVFADDVNARELPLYGNNKWWDVSSKPEDLISYPHIKDWETVSVEHRAERDRFKQILPEFAMSRTTLDAPGFEPPSPGKKKPNQKQKK